MNAAKPTVEQSVNQLMDSIEGFARRAKPSAREIFITQEVDAIRTSAESRTRTC